MKKIVPVIVCVALILALGGCGTEAITIENHTWELTFIQSAENGTILGCASDYYEDHKDIDNLIVVDLSCDAPGAYYTEGAYFTITDKTNHNTYDFNYEMQEGSSESMIYYVTSDSDTGMAVTSVTKIDDGTEIPTLIITIGGYTLNFQDR